MHVAGFSPSRFFTLRLDPGEDILLALRDTVQREGIENGVILSGIGSLSRYHFHVVKTINLPPGDTFVAGEGPFDILTVTGLILGGRVHAHIAFSNTEIAMGGHMEEGCHVLTFAMITLAEATGVDFSGWDRVGPLPTPELEDRYAARGEDSTSSYATIAPSALRGRNAPNMGAVCSQRSIRARSSGSTAYWLKSK